VVEAAAKTTTSPSEATPIPVVRKNNAPKRHTHKKLLFVLFANFMDFILLLIDSINTYYTSYIETQSSILHNFCKGGEILWVSPKELPSLLLAKREILPYK
jgi:hypothetical protein